MGEFRSSMLREVRDAGPRIGSLLIVSVLAGGGCTHVHVPNPAFSVSRDEVLREYERLRETPAPLPRPVVVLNGYRSVPTLAQRVRSRLCELTSDDRERFLDVSYFFGSEIDPIVRRAVESVEARWPSDDPAWTVEVDVVGISMGGLIARAAAMPEDALRDPAAPPPDAPPRKRLRIARLYTLGTPHRGARIAETIAPDPAARDMRAGSAFLARLDAGLSDATYELVCYTQLRDTWVGATRAAPPGHFPVWTGGTVWFSHFTMCDNKLLLADIARRLRGLEPIAVAGDPPPSD